VLNREAKITNFIVDGLIQQRLEPTIYHYTTDAVNVLTVWIY